MHREWLILGVNNVCNLHCKMCDVGTQNLETNFAQNLVGAKPLNMPVELFKMIVDQAKTHYPSTKLGYAFTEPLVYPHLGETLKYADDKGFFTTITTNALNLERKSDELIAGGLNELYISLDGLEETHNHIRGNKRSFQKAIEGIAAMKKKAPKIPISIFCVITEWNFQEIFAFLDFMKDHPVAHVGFMHPNYTPESLAQEHNSRYGELYFSTHSNIEETNFEAVDLPVLLDQIKRIKGSSWPFTVSFSPDLDTMEGLVRFYHHPEQKVGKLCNDAFSNVMIKSNGQAIPAHGRCYQLEVGNIYENNLKEIWTSSVYKKFRSDLVKADGLFPACNRCCSAF